MDLFWDFVHTNFFSMPQVINKVCSCFLLSPPQALNGRAVRTNVAPSPSPKGEGGGCPDVASDMEYRAADDFQEEEEEEEEGESPK